MNGRAALVDRWRAIEIAANELESNLSITGNLDLGTAKNNMLDFRGGTGNLQLGLSSMHRSLVSLSVMVTGRL